MNKLEWRVAASLAAVYAVRMLGLFMILPVFALYAENRPDSTPFLAGLAIGIYGLTQAIFQIPLGLLSDKFGRKPIILGGLAVFALGSVVAALADSMQMIIIGRLLQGTGAVAAATMALAADLTREEYRARVMATIGMTIGIAFMVAMVLGPIVNQLVGVSGIFWFTSLLAVCGMLLVAFVVPQPVRKGAHRDAGILKGYLGSALKNASLQRMNIGVFILHLIMTANFLVLPGIFEHGMQLEQADHWMVYLPVFVLSFVASLPLIIYAETRNKIRTLLVACVGVLLVAEVALALGYHATLPLILAFFIFFIGFNFLEAIQPSLVAKYSDIDSKGTAMGIFSSAQFFGIFIGGAIGGVINQYWGTSGVFWFSAIMALVWLGVAYTLPQPRFYLSRVLKLNAAQEADAQALTEQLLAVRGVKDVSVVLEEHVAYLKIDKPNLDEEALSAFSPAST